MPPCEGGYKEFKLGELFEIKGIKQAKCQKDIPTDYAGIPYIVQSTTNNMCSRLVNRQWLIDNNEPPVEGNAIVLGVTLPAVSYQPHEFGASQVITARASFLNEPIGLYFVSLLQKQMARFSYQMKPGIQIYKDTCIHLPVTKSGEIDFQYIEERMRELEEERMRELEAYLAAAGFANCDLTPEEQVALRKFSNGEVKFTSCRIDSLFKIATGRDIIIGKTKHGDIPLISHQHSNNGISQYVQAIPDRRIFCYKDTLPLADRGVFLATTQNKDFHIGTRVKALTFKTGEQSENTRLFLVSAINKLQIFFTEYLTNATDSLPNLEIKLPIVPSGEIDYDFMGTYISAIKKQIIARLKAEIAREHKAYESAING